MTARESEPVSIIVLATLDAVARECASIGLLMDLPDVVVVRHDPPTGVGSGVRRTITDVTGPVSSDVLPLDAGCCLSCAVRDDLLAAVTHLVEAGRWQTVVVALPLATGPEAVAFQLNQTIADQLLPGAVLTSVVTVVDLEALEHDLFGDDLLAERDLALGDMDRRSVGEAVAGQIEYADVVIAVAPGAPTAESLLRHLVAPTSQFHAGWNEVHAPNLVDRTHNSSVARHRVDPLHARANGAPDSDHVWTVELTTSRPLHPARLLHHIERLSGGRVRSRGYFWLPSRPGTACIWDGSGGQLSIGHVGPWRRRRPGTRLVVTGVDADDRRRIEHTFAQVVASADEVSPHHRWAETEDGFEPWLGPHHSPTLQP